MANIKWEDPPDEVGHGRKGRWESVARELKKRPGEWALIAEDIAVGLQTRIRQGQGVWAPAGAFEARAHVLPNRETQRVKVWARYVGSEEGSL